MSQSLAATCLLDMMTLVGIILRQECEAQARKRAGDQGTVSLSALDINGNARGCDSMRTDRWQLGSSSVALQEAVVTLSRCPLIANPPPLVMDSRNLTLLDLGSREYLASSDLPPACQVRAEQHTDSPHDRFQGVCTEEESLLSAHSMSSLGRYGRLVCHPLKSLMVAQ